MIAALGAVVLGVIGTTGAAHAADEPWLSRGEKGYTFRDTTIGFADTDKCLDAAAEEIGDNGGKVQLWIVGSHSGDLFLESKANGGDRFGAPSLTDGAPVGLYHW